MLGTIRARPGLRALFQPLSLNNDNRIRKQVEHDEICSSYQFGCFDEYQRCCTQPEQRRREPSLEGTAHPGTAILNSAGIYAGVPTSNVVLVHPGTALLDSMGIFAGEPSAVPMVDGSTAVGETVTLK